MTATKAITKKTPPTIPTIPAVPTKFSDVSCDRLRAVTLWTVAHEHTTHADILPYI